VYQALNWCTYIQTCPLIHTIDIWLVWNNWEVLLSFFLPFTKHNWQLVLYLLCEHPASGHVRLTHWLCRIKSVLTHCCMKSSQPGASVLFIQHWFFAVVQHLLCCERIVSWLVLGTDFCGLRIIVFIVFYIWYFEMCLLICQSCVWWYNSQKSKLVNFGFGKCRRCTYSAE